MIEGEDVRKIVKELGQKLQVDIQDSDMAAAHRLPAKTNNPPLIVKFIKYEMKPSIVTASKKIKLKGGSLKYTPALPIYCSAHLTQKVKTILSAAKKLCQEGIVKYVYMRDGNSKSAGIRPQHNTPDRRYRTTGSAERKNPT